MADFDTEKVNTPQVEITPAFVVPIFTIKVKNWDEKKKKLLSLVDWNNPDHNNNDQFSDYHPDVNSLYLDDFMQIIEEELSSFVSVHQQSFMLQNVWAQRYKTENFMRVHTHGSIGFSAVLFAEFDVEEHSATTFFGPVKNPLTDIDQTYTPAVTEGTLILFPKYLLHYVSPNTSTKDRTIFSFNLEPHRNNG